MNLKCGSVAEVAHNVIRTYNNNCHNKNKTENIFNCDQTCIKNKACYIKYKERLHAEEDIVLRANAKALPDSAKLWTDVFAHDVCCARCRWKQTSQDGPETSNKYYLSHSTYQLSVKRQKKNLLVSNSSVSFLHGGGFPCSIVSQKGCNLTLVESQCQAVYSKLFAMTIDLHQVLNIHPQVKMSGLFLYTRSFKIKKYC